MQDRTAELEHFKTQIDLAAFAMATGYAVDRKASSRSSLVLENGSGDKVIVARGLDGHWIYFSVRDDADNGSIIDFVQRREGGSLGDVRKRLRAFLGADHSPALLPTAPPIRAAATDVLRIRARFEGMTALSGHHDYLETERRIPAEVLQSPRFQDRVRSDHFRNAVFPHWNAEGICGYEIKNRGFTGFAPGGSKGLWLSRLQSSDQTLVVCESAIDALSYFALKSPPTAQFCSTAGALNPGQPELLRLAAQRLPPGGRVVLAVDNDPGGDALAGALREALGSLENIEVLEDRPALRGMDWNDELRGLP